MRSERLLHIWKVRKRLVIPKVLIHIAQTQTQEPRAQSQSNSKHREKCPHLAAPTNEQTSDSSGAWTRATGGVAPYIRPFDSALDI